MRMSAQAGRCSQLRMVRNIVKYLKISRFSACCERCREKFQQVLPSLPGDIPILLGVLLGMTFHPGLEFHRVSPSSRALKHHEPAEASLLPEISGAEQEEASGSPEQSRALEILCPLWELCPLCVPSASPAAGGPGEEVGMELLPNSAIQGMSGLRV